MDLPKNILQDTLDAVYSAGEILKKYFGNDLDFIHKDEGYATKADLESEECLLEALGSIFPEAAVCAEESGENGNSRYCWVVDPLDGTTNYSRGIPYFSMSVALTDNDVPVLGVVYNPATSEIFYAQKGVGAYRNGQEIKLDFVDKPLSEGLLAASFSYKSDDDHQKMWDSLRLIRSKCYTTRHFGSAALDLAYVAGGMLDGVFFEKLKWWDVAAGLCIAQVAGAKVTDFEGHLVGKGFESCVVASNKMHTEILDLLKKC